MEDQKKYKVIALTVGGLNNKIFKSGDIVTENNFREGRAEELVKAGFLDYADKKVEIKKKVEIEKPIEKVTEKEKK